jgi:hypothetical protein
MLNYFFPFIFSLFVFAATVYSVDEAGKLYTGFRKVRLIGFLRFVVPHYPYAVGTREANDARRAGHAPRKAAENQATESSYCLLYLGVMLVPPTASAVFWALRPACFPYLTVYEASLIIYIVAVCAPFLTFLLFAGIPNFRHSAGK